MKIRDVIKMIERDGWYLVRTKEVIGNINTQASLVELLLLVTPDTILLQEH